MHTLKSITKANSSVVQYCTYQGKTELLHVMLVEAKAGTSL